MWGWIVSLTNLLMIGNRSSNFRNWEKDKHSLLPTASIICSLMDRAISGVSTLNSAILYPVCASLEKTSSLRLYLTPAELGGAGWIVYWQKFMAPADSWTWDNVLSNAFEWIPYPQSTINASLGRLRIIWVRSLAVIDWPWQRLNKLKIAKSKGTSPITMLSAIVKSITIM